MRVESSSSVYSPTSRAGTLQKSPLCPPLANTAHHLAANSLNSGSFGSWWSLCFAVAVHSCFLTSELHSGLSCELSFVLLFAQFAKLHCHSLCSRAWSCTL